MAHRSSRRSVRGRARTRRPGRRARAVRGTARVGTRARPRPLDRSRLAGRVRRARRDARRAGDLLRGVRALPAARDASASSAKACSARRSCTSGPTRRSAAFLPGILSGTEIWCQGYSEPDAGSDLANVQTRADLDGDEWVINGQKVWTSLAHWAQWIFVIARTDRVGAQAQGPVVPARADGPARPHRDPADRADHRAQRVQRDVLRRRAHRRPRTSSARSTRAGASRWARSRSSGARRRSANSSRSRASSSRSPTSRAPTGSRDDPVFRQRLADAWITLRVMRFHALRTLPMLEHGTVDPATSIHKLLWATFHRGLGELAVDVLGAGAVATDPRRRPPDRACSSTRAPTRSTAARTRSNAT